MKLYMHPVSITSRPIRLFAAESGIEMEEQVIDLMTGEHHGPAFAALNPNKLVPVLEDGDLRLTESSAILKYLAEKIDSPAYPKDPARRAKVNEMMDWFNTNFYRDYGYNLVYPQIFPHQARPSEQTQRETIAWGIERAKNWLTVLNDHWIGPEQAYLCGDEITIADYLGISMLTLGEVIRCDFSAYPNVERWMGNMKRLSNWETVNEVFYGFAESVKDQPFESI
jgi:glutathione S-transferase